MFACLLDDSTVGADQERLTGVSPHRLAPSANLTHRSIRLCGWSNSLAFFIDLIDPAQPCFRFWTMQQLKLFHGVTRNDVLRTVPVECIDM